MLRLFHPAEIDLGRITVKVRAGRDEYLFPIQGMAASVVSGPDGNIWYGIADSIVKLTPAGEATTFRVSGSQPAVEALAAGPDGNVWFSVALAYAPESTHI